MKKLLFALVVLSFFYSCKEKTETKENVQAEIKYSGDFLPAAFEDDTREEQIKGLADELHELIVAHAEERHIPGIAYGVVVDNELVLSSATGLMNRERELAASTSTAFRIASMSKSFTAMAIVRLRDEGRLSLSDPVSRYIPEMDSITYLTKDSHAR